MASEVYFKFKSSVKTDSVLFDGSAISVKELKCAIKTKCCLRSADLDLKLEDSSGKEYVKDSELIPKFTSIIVRRVPKLNGENQKRRPVQTSFPRDKHVHQTDPAHSNIANLADSDLTEEEKIRLMIDRSSEAYSTKNYTVKAKAFGVPPPTYTCHKCNQGGHWIHECPGIKDDRGNLIDSKTVKRPTGIPQDFLVRVDPGTPGAYLDKCGRYMVPIKDAEAYSQKKKEKRAFSLEENPPYVPPQVRTPSAGLVCPLCKKLLQDAVIITCCGTSYCNECITNHCFVAGSQKCPNCGAPAEKYDTAIIENAAMRRAVTDWLRAGNSSEVPCQKVSPDVAFKISTSESEKVVRRLLKPKQPVIVSSGNPENGPVSQDVCGETKDSKVEVTDTKKEDDSPVKPELSTELTCSKTLSFPSKSESPAHVKSTPIESHTPPVVSNTSSVVNMPCANSFGAENDTSVLPTLPNVTSLYNGAPLVFPGESASLANAVYGANLAATLTTVGAAQAPINSVFPSNSLVPSGSVWPSVDLSLLGGVDQSGFVNPGNVFASVNPLVDLQNAVGSEKLLSKEEFYRMKQQFLEMSSKRWRSSHSRESPRSRRRGGSRRRAAADYYYRRSDEERRLHKRSPTRRRRSHSSDSDHRPTRGDGAIVEDYDTWRRRKERRMQLGVPGSRRMSPFHGSRRSGSLDASPLTSAARRESSPHEYSADHNRRYPDEVDKSRLRSPFHGGSPTQKSWDEASSTHGATCRHQTRRYRCEESECARKRSFSREGSMIPGIVSPSPQNASDELDAKALKKLRKEQKKKARRQRKLAKRAQRAAAAAASGACSGEGIYDDLDGVSPVLPDEGDRDDATSSKSKRDKRKKKRRHRRERDMKSDSESDVNIKRKKQRSRKYTSTDEEADELVEVC